MSTKVIRLDREHTHNALKYPVGATLPPLEAKVADWLIALKVGHEEVTAAGAPNTITHTPSPPIRRGGCCGGRW